MSLETITLPVISTGHLSQQTYEDLERSLMDDDGAFSIYGAVYAGGMFVRLDSAAEEHALAGLRGDYPDLAALAVWAEHHGFAWVRLDPDADVASDLPIFDW